MHSLHPPIRKTCTASRLPIVSPTPSRLRIGTGTLQSPPHFRHMEINDRHATVVIALAHNVQLHAT
ncbi:hypothetical protein Micbo1qcDRAFT_160218 [Microdochium bolleyi]|uniref:Uncharacterized protein n=1 Tax=Microdochium bolleyi TaxID=196109 RepID=A0A136JCL4_9PEZI|nr:hypothetical protein Micbo1qcDRAFT_160218 [Microdochium bolleyi]